jgi:DNA-binding LacI/PurR family transcriptional regulator
VPVSPSNNAHDVDWKRLDFINSDSKVLAFGYWYSDLFPLFKKLGCRVSFIENQSYHCKIYADFLKDWAVLTIDRFNAAKAAVRFLADRGCRRIALVRCDLDKKDHPSLLGYKAGLAGCGISYAVWLNAMHTDDEIITEIIADLYKKNKFDALLLDPYLICKLRTQHSLNYYLGLPESVKIMADFESIYNQRVFPSLSSTDFPYEEIGRIAAQRLLEDKFRKEQQIFNGVIIERESTMHENDRLTLSTAN